MSVARAGQGCEQLAGPDQARIKICAEKRPFFQLGGDLTAAPRGGLPERQGLTRIAVTHRLEEPLLRKYDEILVLKNGEICERGSFDTLMARREQFYSLFNVANG